jgi:hypothetical protein
VQREIEAAFAGTIGAVTAQADGSGAPAERSVEGASPEDPESRPARSTPARR